MLVLFLSCSLLKKEQWERLFCCLLQTFLSPLVRKENLCLSNRIGLWMVYFLLFFMDFFQYFHGLVQLLSHTENTCQHCFVSFLVAFLSFTHLGDSVYDAPRLKLPYEICNVVPQHNQTHNRYRSLIVPKSSWYLFKSLLKISWIISFISLLIIISRFRSYQGFFTSLLVT